MKTASRFRACRLAPLAILCVLPLAGCVKHVSRIAPEQAIDLSGRWNDVDSRLVAESLIQQSFEPESGTSWALRFAPNHGGRRPTVIVGTMENRSLEHVPTATFVRDLERAYVGSGLVQVVASPEERVELREERQDQQENAAADTRATPGLESGADYMLQGEIQSIEDREGGRSVVYYQVDVALTDLQSNAKVWVGQHKIKKYVKRPRFGF
jgi:hypothetical protein